MCFTTGNDYRSSSCYLSLEKHRQCPDYDEVIAAKEEMLCTLAMNEVAFRKHMSHILRERRLRKPDSRWLICNGKCSPFAEKWSFDVFLNAQKMDINETFDIGKLSFDTIERNQTLKLHSAVANKVIRSLNESGGNSDIQAMAAFNAHAMWVLFWQFFDTYPESDIACKMQKILREIYERFIHGELKEQDL